jgi:hypothetical protein
MITFPLPCFATFQIFTMYTPSTDLDPPVNEIVDNMSDLLQEDLCDISRYLLCITPQDADKIRDYVLKSRPDCLDMEHVPVNWLDLDSGIGSKFCRKTSRDCGWTTRVFLCILCLYVDGRDGTYKDVIKILNKGKDVERFPYIYMGRDDEGEIPYLEMVLKLFGLNVWPTKMDCPRVWDLHEDKVIDNPTIRGDPGYIAAITHRWGSNEVTYRDLMKLEQTNAILVELGKDPKSTQISLMSDKLAMIRKELGNQIRYVWIDTLCIDKTSSVELDMSIRSMYRWYSNASFVYLEYFTNFDEWCTRGWTLQEGHAAKSLRVSPKHGNSFMDLIAKMSDDDVYNLALFETHGQTSYAYWKYLMKSRETTMIEDKAYALVGLLDIDFQIAYGEGDRAVSRICEEIARQRGDVSWLVDNISRKDMNKLHLDTQTVQVTSAGITSDVVYVGDITESSGFYKYEKECERVSQYWIPSNNVYFRLKKNNDLYSYRLEDLGREYRIKDTNNMIVRRNIRLSCHEFRT